MLMLISAPVSAQERLRVSSGFGVRTDPLRGGPAVHRGIDLPVARGTPVLAAASGVVTAASVRGGYGNLVEIAHPDGSRTRYGHLARILVGVGSMVRRGETVGLAGATGRATGSHLHFELRIAGRAVDPLGHLGGRSGDAQPSPPARPSPPPAAEPHRSAFSIARAARGREGIGGLPGGADVVATQPD